jgi:hypothetical protein
MTENFDHTAETLAARKTVELRKLAKFYGLREVGGRPVNSGRKADLIEHILKAAETLRASDEQLKAGANFLANTKRRMKAKSLAAEQARRADEASDAAAAKNAARFTEIDKAAEAEAAKFSVRTVVETPDGRGVVTGKPVLTPTGYVVTVQLYRKDLTPFGIADYAVSVLKLAESEPVKSAPKAKRPAKRKSGKPRCQICKSADVDYKTQGRDSTMCEPCFEYAGWENTHTDDRHEEATKPHRWIELGMAECPVCEGHKIGPFAPAKSDGQIHKKALAFEAEARKAGWNALARTGFAANGGPVVSIVTATRGAEDLTIIWDGAACRNTGTKHKGPDGKVRQVRNASAARKILTS